MPLIVQFFTWYLVIPELLPEKIVMWFKAELDPNIQFFLSSMLCLGLFTAARVCEQVRAAIQSLPRGQKNAALAMGLTLPQAYRYDRSKPFSLRSGYVVCRTVPQRAVDCAILYLVSGDPGAVAGENRHVV